MKCMYCKEEIADNAIKCKYCKEFVNKRFRILKWLFASFTLFIPFLSLMLAGWQTYAKNVIEQEKNEVEGTLILTQEILDEIPVEVIKNITLSRIKNEIIKKESSSLFVEEELESDIRRKKIEQFEERKKYFNNFYEQIQQGNLDDAEQMVQNRLEKNPNDQRTKKDLIYLKTLKKKQ